MLSLNACILAIALGGGDVVLVDFYADWCAPCQQMAPVVRELEAAGYPIRRVNVDQQPDIVRQYDVRSIPCFVMLADGSEVDRHTGTTNAAGLQTMFRSAGYHTASAARGGNTSRGAIQLTSGTALPAMSSGESFAATLHERAAPAPAEPNARTIVRGQSPNDLDARLLAASVRLRIEDGGGHSVGSGTVIDSDDREALILTCGHVFRESRGKGRVTIDLFAPGAPQGVVGQVVHYDLERDVALVRAPVAGRVPVARVARPGYRATQGDVVYAVGCSHGADPTVETCHVASVDKFVGPPNSNLTITGMPVQGRSGGGLFTADGLVVGVCNAADPTDDEGLFAALGSIHGELDRAGLAAVYRRPQDLQTPQPPAIAQTMPPADHQRRQAASAAAASVIPTSAVTLAPAEQAALELIRSRAHDAEIVCVIRSRTDPRADSEIIVLDHASAAFVEELAAEAGRHSRQAELTSLPGRPSAK